MINVRKKILFFTFTKKDVLVNKVIYIKGRKGLIIQHKDPISDHYSVSDHIVPFFPVAQSL